MTRKDYILIAAALREAERHALGCRYKASAADMREVTAHFLADALERDNPRFDRGRFLTAARVQS